MAKRQPVFFGNVGYHVLNRGNGRNPVFHKEGDDAAFLKLLKRASKRSTIRLLCYCLIPNHLHLVLGESRIIGAHRFFFDAQKRDVLCAISRNGAERTGREKGYRDQIGSSGAVDQASQQKR